MPSSHSRSSFHPTSIDSLGNGLDSLQLSSSTVRTPSSSLSSFSPTLESDHLHSTPGIISSNGSSSEWKDLSASSTKASANAPLQNRSKFAGGATSLIGFQLQADELLDRIFSDYSDDESLPSPPQVPSIAHSDPDDGQSTIEIEGKAITHELDKEIEDEYLEDFLTYDYLNRGFLTPEEVYNLLLDSWKGR